MFVLAHLETHIQTLEQQLAEIDTCLLNAMQPYAWAHQLLQTIPGIDKIAAALILIEIGDDMARFGRAESLANWAALSPGNNESAGKRKSGRTGHGNAVIRFILCECANAARNTKSTLAAKYRSLMVRKSHKKAIIAIAHKMIRLIFLMLSRRQPYIDQGIDYAAMSAKKNAPRWIKQLKAIGRWLTHGRITKLARPAVRTGSARRAKSHSSDRVQHGSMISSTQNFSALRKGERSAFRRASLSSNLAWGSAAASMSAR